jgi:23S rRNA (uracil1939-C5)-methyltransferase
MNHKHQSLLSKRSPKKVQAIIDALLIHDVTHDGRGVGRFDGKVVFVAGALPDEIVRVRITKQKSQYTEADLIDLLTPSENRVIPECAHASSCGGCQLQHMRYEAQVNTKSALLARSLTQKSLVVKAIAEPLTAEPFAYRRRAKFVVNRKRELCFRSIGGQAQVPISTCSIMTVDMNLLLQGLQKDLQSEALSAHSLLDVEMWDLQGCYLQLTVDAKWRAQQTEQWQQWAADHHVLGLSFISEHNRTFAEDAFPVAPMVMHYSVAGLSLSVGEDQFIQANARMNDKMVQQACDWLEPTMDDVAIDLFCGIGNFTLPLAKRVSQVLGLELNAQSVERAQQNARDNAIENAQFAIGNLFDADWHLPKETTLMLLDPPWDGALSVCEKIKKNKHLKKIVYVSCHPASLARDLAILQAGGFKIQRAGLVDQFPQTYHIESMVLLTR